MPQFATPGQALQYIQNPGAPPPFQAPVVGQVVPATGSGPMEAPQYAAPAGNLAKIEAKMDEILKVVSKVVGDTETLKQKIARICFLVEMGDTVNSIAVRPFMGKQMPQDPKQLGCENTFKECGLPVPQK
jgi:hypothetical protein